MTGPQLERLKLAYALVTAREVVDADAETDYAEQRMMGMVFPRPMLRDAGFIDDAGRTTPTLHEACAEARRVLAAELSEEERLDLFKLLLGAARSDDSLAPREVTVLRRAARTLGILGVVDIAELISEAEGS